LRLFFLVSVTPPAQRVQFILGEDADDGTGHETHPLFSELGELVRDGDDFEWKEVSKSAYDSK
jgi:solute carrier family 4 (sodium bicarbonate transporter), member 10